MANESERTAALGDVAARQLANATKTVPQMSLITPRWLTLLLQAHGSDVLRVKGILNVAGLPTPVAIHGVQHLIHTPVHLESWPDDDRRSRIVFIVRDIAREDIERSFAAFQKALGAQVTDVLTLVLKQGMVLALAGVAIACTQLQVECCLVAMNSPSPSSSVPKSLNGVMASLGPM